MAKAKGRHRREGRLREISGAPELPEAPSDAGEDGEFGEPQEFKIQLTDDDRAITRMVHGTRGQLLDFALVQQVRDGGRWRDVIRYDCDHGKVHVHRFTKGKKSATKKEICGLEEIDGGCDIAEHAIFDGWEENRRRYFNG